MPFGLLAPLHVLAGYWLARSRPAGAWLGIGLLPVTFIFWIGFAIPVWLVAGPSRALLVVAGRKDLGSGGTG